MSFRFDSNKIFGAATIVMVVLITDYLALANGFWTDDHIFLELAARYSLPEFINRFFNPLAQVTWYRPVEGVLWWFEWQMFQGNSAAYHVVLLLFHSFNCIMLYAITQRVTGQRLAGLIAGLVFAGVSTFHIAILWLSDITVPTTSLYLATVWFWLSYLEKETRRDYIFSILSFVLTLLLKEIGTMLPFVLFLVDRLLIAKPLNWKNLLKRYLPFVILLIPYVLFYVTRFHESGWVTVIGFNIGLHLVNNVLRYLALIIFPQRLDSPLSYLWLAVALTIYLYLAIRYRDRRLVFLGVACVVVMIPFLPFLNIYTRYVYLPTLFPAIGFGLLVNWVRARMRLIPLSNVVLGVFLAALTVVNGLKFAEEAENWNGFVRSTRLPFRAISQKHPTLLPDTLFYFLDQPGGMESGMFFLRYGSSFAVGGDITNSFTAWYDVPTERANLRSHQQAFVEYLGDDGEFKEQAVERQDDSLSQPVLPAKFEFPVQLDGYELASQKLKRNDALIALLYWRASARLVENYTVFVHLVNSKGEITAGGDHEPREGKRQTSTWKPGELIVDWAIIPITTDTPNGQDYRLEVGLYQPSTQKRFPILDANGNPVTDAVLIGPFEVLE